MESKISTETYFSRPSNHKKVSEEDEHSWIENKNSESSTASYSSTAPITEMLGRRAATTTTPKFQWERKFPNISYLINQKAEWDALLKVLKLTEDTINNKGIYNKDQNIKEIQNMQRMYKDWWTLIRSTQSLHESNVRKLSKLIRAFIIAAMEEPTHTVQIERVTAAAKEKTKSQMNQQLLKSYTKSIQVSSFQPQRSLAFQNKVAITPEKTKDLDFEPIKLESGAKSSQGISSISTRLSKDFPSIISRLQMTEPNSLIVRSKKASSLGLESSTSLPSYIMSGINTISHPSNEDGSKDTLTAQATGSITKLEEMYYMQIILKDILKDISKSTERQEAKPRKLFPKSSGYGGSFRKRSLSRKCWSCPLTLLPSKIPSKPVLTSLVRKTKKGMSDGQRALNEINRLRNGLWPRMTYGEGMRRFPSPLQNLKNFYVKKSLLVPQERAKRVLNSNFPSAYKTCIRELGSKRFG